VAFLRQSDANPLHVDVLASSLSIIQLPNLLFASRTNTSTMSESASALIVFSAACSLPITFQEPSDLTYTLKLQIRDSRYRDVSPKWIGCSTD
jgi:hypothetical protein